MMREDGARYLQQLEGGFHGLHMPSASSAYWTGSAVVAIVVVLVLLAIGGYLVVKHRTGTYAEDHERERRSQERRLRQGEKARQRRLRQERRHQLRTSNAARTSRSTTIDDERQVAEAESPNQGHRPPAG